MASNTIHSFILPNFPTTTKWLSEEERAYAVWRIAQDIGQDDENEQEPTMIQSVWLAVSDYRTWMFVAMQHCILLAQTVTFFFPSIVGTLGYDNVTSKFTKKISTYSPLLNLYHSPPINLPCLGGNVHRHDGERILRIPA